MVVTNFVAQWTDPEGYPVILHGASDSLNKTEKPHALCTKNERKALDRVEVVHCCNEGG